MHVARENALEKAASGFSVITCSDSLSSAAEASLCRRGAGEKEKGKRATDDGKGKDRKLGIPSGSLCGGERF